jgi:hypothetical protein
MLCGTVYIVQAVAHKALPYLRAPYSLYVTSIYAILRLVCLFGTLYLFSSSWLSGVGLDRNKVC